MSEDRTANLLGAVALAITDAMQAASEQEAPEPGAAAAAIALLRHDPGMPIERLRRPPAGVPVVLARVEGGRGLVDLRCVPAERDDDVREALAVALADVDASQ